MNEKIYKMLSRTVNALKKKRGITGKYCVINRGRDHKNLLYILAGYKPGLWDSVFNRICREIPKDFDVCIISSGLYEPRLKRIAEENGWSYIYSKKNLISNIQNYTISQFSKAEVIWKLDEDMLICKDYFEIISETKMKAEKELDYEIGFVGPLIPINSYGYIRFLSRCDKLAEYEQRFGVAKVGFAKRRAINLHSFWANKYLWEITGNIDDKAKEFNLGNRDYSLCFGRFSIGAIMFDRKLWTDMGGFETDRYPCDGRDETDILKYCALHSKAIVVAEDALVGHHSFAGLYQSIQEFMDNDKIQYF